MALDLTRVASQIGGMVDRLKESSEESQKRLENALNVLREKAPELDALKARIAASKTTWLVAGLVDGLDRRYQSLPLPGEYSVIATDGSHIDVDRHRSTRCYLINIGSITLYYGTNPGASLDSNPRLYFGDEDMVIAPTGAKGREQLIEGALLGIKRSVDECRRLAVLAAGMPPDSQTLALLDGTLIHWGLEAYPDFVTDTLLDRGFLSCLDDIQKLNNNRRLALASYISFPRSTDVVNALRVAICPHQPADCDRYCPASRERDCDTVAGVRDRELFMKLLEPGERSDTFFTKSSIVQKHYGVHHVYFFYLKAGDEIARIEVPQWVAASAILLDLTHTLILDQCRRGQGYPVALSEAHEKAVVSGADRENFWQLVESSLVEGHLSALSSVKSLSKRTRWI